MQTLQRSDMYGDPPYRALSDMVDVAILKNPAWGEVLAIPAPILSLSDQVWVERPDNLRKIMIWENFDKEAIMDDFYAVMKTRR